MLWSFIGLVAAETGKFQYQAPQAPERASGWELWGQVLYFLLVFVFVIGLTYLVTRILANRTKFTRQSRHLRVIDELPLGAGRSILLLDCIDKIVVVGACDKSLSPLGHIDEPELVARLREQHETNDTETVDFGAMLQRALRPGPIQPSLDPSPLADAQRSADGLRDLTRQYGKQRTE